MVCVFVPFTDDNIHLCQSIGQLDLFKFAMDNGHNMVQLVVRDDLLGLIGDAGTFDTNDTGGTSLRCEHRKNAGTTSNIQYNLVLEQMAVLDDTVHVCASANVVLQHLLMDAEMRIGIEVVIS